MLLCVRLQFRQKSSDCKKLKVVTSVRHRRVNGHPVHQLHLCYVHRAVPIGPEDRERITAALASKWPKPKRRPDGWAPPAIDWGDAEAKAMRLVRFEQLGREAQRRLTSEFQRMVEPLVPEMTVRARRLMRSTQSEANDLLQDTLERGIRRFNQYRDGTNFRRWLLTIMQHIFLDQRRRSGRTVTMELPDDIAAPEPETAPGLGGDWQRSWQEVAEAMERLPRELRSVIDLQQKRGRQRSYREMAKLLKVPVGTIGTRLLRARRKLRSLLGEAETVASD